MLCENCGKNTATTHIKKVINGVSTQKYLCGSCAAKLGFTNLGGGSIAGMLSSFLGDMLTENTGLNTKRCKGCGTGFSEIIESGKVGCAECYNEFYNDLLPYIKRVHGSVKHIGKVPNSAPLAAAEPNRIALLKQHLNDLVAREEFEAAAKVRDEIKELEAKEMQ